jgi:hypothetical protein
VTSLAGPATKVYRLSSENLLYFRAFTRKSPATFMDAFWSIFGMPIGVTLCFGPALVVWWFTKDSEPGPDDSHKH